MRIKEEAKAKAPTTRNAPLGTLSINDKKDRVMSAIHEERSKETAFGVPNIMFYLSDAQSNTHLRV